MDSRRFDAIARSAAIPATRRSALGALVAGGLLGVFGSDRAEPASVAAQGEGGLCVVDFGATVRQGPSASRPLVAGGAPGELHGYMRFSLSGNGDLQTADLLLDDGSSLPVVGQATGHGFQARIDLGQGRALVAVGVGEQDVTRCLGRLDGPATGPEVGDLGEWHAAAGVQNLPVGAGGTASGGRGNRPASGSTGGGGNRSNGGVSNGGGEGRSNSGDSTGASSGRACSQGQTRCGNACVDLQSDPRNCGQCSLPCASELGPGTCIAGTCACSPGTTRCNDSCANLERDPRNCGGCSNTCRDGQTCLGGRCTPDQGPTSSSSTDGGSSTGGGSSSGGSSTEAHSAAAAPLRARPGLRPHQAGAGRRRAARPGGSNRAASAAPADGGQADPDD